MSAPAYPEYKDSGLPWLGRIPKNWATAAIKWMVDDRRPITYGIVQAGPHTPGGIPYIRPADMSAEKGVTDLDGILCTTPEIAAPYQRSVIRSGDVVCSIGPSFGKVMIVPEELEGGNLTQGTARLAPASTVDAKFLFWLLRSNVSFAQWESAVGGATFRALNLEPLANTIACRPPKSEQQAIATFLDRETAKIDALVAEQQRLVALLKEKRQAVISYAVTKGLNPRAPMKHSGIEWLGEIPAHWAVLPMKRYWSVTDCKHVTAEFVDDGFPLASIREVQSKFVQLDDAKCTTEEFYNLLREGDRDPQAGDLVFSRNATVGEVAQVTDQHPPFAMGQDVCLLRKLDSSFSTGFLQYVLRSSVGTVQMDHAMIGSTFKRINVEEIRSLHIPFPPTTEQNDIAEFAESAGQKADALIGEARAAITLLQERRAALISAVVTGKIDVRGLVDQQELEAA